MNYLRKNGVGCGVYYPLTLHLQDCFSYLEHRKGDFPVSESLADSVLSIPIYSELTTEQLNYVIETIKTFYNQENL